MKPSRSWSIGWWIVTTVTVSLVVLIGSIWRFRDFDDALAVAAEFVPLVFVAILTLGATEVASERRSKTEDARRKEDRRAVEREAYRLFQRDSLTDLQDRFSTADRLGWSYLRLITDDLDVRPDPLPVGTPLSWQSELLDFARYDSPASRAHRAELRERHNDLVQQVREAIADMSPLIHRIDDDDIRHFALMTQDRMTTYFLVPSPLNPSPDTPNALHIARSNHLNAEEYRRHRESLVQLINTALRDFYRAPT